MTSSALKKFRKGWMVQYRVLHALTIRELHTRFGRENIGFLWIMVEPLLFAGLVAIIWRFMKGPEEHGVGIAAFVVSGYIPVVMFRHSVARSIAIFQANSSLLYHRQVKIVDFILVRFFIEFIGGMMGYFLIAIILMLFDQFPVPADIGLFLAGWMLYAFFSLSVCLVVAPLSEMSEVIEKFIPVLTYIMIPFSGLFTMASWLTPGMREYLLWSPWVHGMEMMRSGIWGSKLTAYYDGWYLFACSIVISAIGLILCRIIRRDMAIQ